MGAPREAKMRLALLLVLALPLLAQAGTNAKGKAFLEANKDKPGVVTLASGMQYKVLRKGNGRHHPTVDSPCECHYEGTLIDGTKFDSSYDRGSPTTFAPNQVIKGWTEAMQLMVEGDKWEMYIPSELGYGDSGSPPKIGGGSALIFTMEIIKINGNKVPASKCDVKTLDKCSAKEAKYVDKTVAKFDNDSAKMEAELERLTKMVSGKMKPNLVVWINKRQNILRSLIAASKSDGKDEL